MTFAELKAEAAGIVAAARAAGRIGLADPPPPVEHIYAPRVRARRDWSRRNVTCKYCKTPIPKPAPLQVMCDDTCRRLQRNLKGRQLAPPNTDKSRARYKARAKQQKAYHAQLLADARAYRKLHDLPLRSPRSTLIEHANAYRNDTRTIR
jgi:hypothetical protein